MGCVRVVKMGIIPTWDLALSVQPDALYALLVQYAQNVQLAIIGLEKCAILYVLKNV
jgi:hypothetical protein